MAKKIRLLTLALTILAPPYLIHAQQPPNKIPRIGFLTDGRVNPAPGPFRQGLRDLGWVEGKNIVIEYRFADGNEDRLPGLAAQLVHANVDIIVSTGLRATVAARQVTKNIPIVATFVGERLNLAHPEQNVTGVSAMPRELAGKRLELLKEVVPTATRVAVLANPSNGSHAAFARDLKVAGRTLGTQLQVVEATETHRLAEPHHGRYRRVRPIRQV